MNAFSFVFIEHEGRVEQYAFIRATCPGIQKIPPSAPPFPSPDNEHTFVPRPYNHHQRLFLLLSSSFSSSRVLGITSYKTLFLLLPDASGIKDSPFFSMKTTMSDDQSPTMSPLDSTLFSALTNDNGGRKRRRERKIPLCFGRGRNERACAADAKCEMKPN